MKKNGVIFCLICFSILLFTQCGYRISSKKRFSKSLDIIIPKGIEVIKDEYQDMGQDFVIEYEIKLTKDQMGVLAKSIRGSKYFKPNVMIEKQELKDMVLPRDGENLVWGKTNFGYAFQDDPVRNIYSARVDTVSMLAVFRQAQD